MADPTAQSKLNDKQKRFVDFYCGDARLNKARAARMAGYSEKTCRQIGLQLYKTSHIRARIDEVLDGEIPSGPEVLWELGDVALRGLGEFIEITKWDQDGEPIAAKMDASAKMKALELLGKHHQLFSENLNIHGGIEIREYVDLPEDLP